MRSFNRLVLCTCVLLPASVYGDTSITSEQLEPITLWLATVRLDRQPDEGLPATPVIDGQDLFIHTFNKISGAWNDVHSKSIKGYGKNTNCAHGLDEAFRFYPPKIVQVSLEGYYDSGRSQPSEQARNSLARNRNIYTMGAKNMCRGADSALQTQYQLAEQFFDQIEEVAFDDELLQLTTERIKEERRLAKIERERQLAEQRERERLAKIERDKQIAAKQERDRLAKIERDKQIAEQRERDRLAKIERDKQIAAQRELDRIEKDRLDEERRLEEIEYSKKLAAQRELVRIELDRLDKSGIDPFSPKVLSLLEPYLKADPDNQGHYAPFEQNSCQLAAAADLFNTKPRKDFAPFSVFPYIVMHPEEFDEAHTMSLVTKGQMPNVHFVGTVINIQDIDDLVAYTMEHGDNIYYLAMYKALVGDFYEEFGFDKPNVGDFACGRLMGPIIGTVNYGSGKGPGLTGTPVKLPMTNHLSTE